MHSNAVPEWSLTHLALSRKPHHYKALQAIEPIVYPTWAATNVSNDTVTNYFTIVSVSGQVI